MSHTLSYKDGSLGAHSTLTAYENGSLGSQSQAYHDGSLGFTQPVQYESGSLGDAYTGGPNDSAINNGSFGSLLEAYESGSLGAAYHDGSLGARIQGSPEVYSKHSTDAALKAIQKDQQKARLESAFAYLGRRRLPRHFPSCVSLTAKRKAIENYRKTRRAGWVAMAPVCSTVNSRRRQFNLNGLQGMDLGTSNVLFAVAGAISGYFLMKKKKHKVAGATLGAALGAYFSSKQAQDVAESVKTVAVPEAGITTEMIEESNATGGCGCGA